MGDCRLSSDRSVYTCDPPCAVELGSDGRGLVGHFEPGRGPGRGRGRVGTNGQDAQPPSRNTLGLWRRPWEAARYTDCTPPAHTSPARLYLPPPPPSAASPVAHRPPSPPPSVTASAAVSAAAVRRSRLPGSLGGRRRAEMAVGVGRAACQTQCQRDGCLPGAPLA